MLRLRNLKLLFICTVFLVITACSQPKEHTNNPKQLETPKVETTAVVKPKMGEVSCILPKGWISAPQSQPKETEVLSYIRKDDQKLWASPSPIGTGNLPVMSLTISLRDAKADRSDLDPKKLGNSLVKQKVFTELVRAEEIKIANLPATIVVGNAPERGRTSIIMLPYNGYLYKWTLDGTKEADMETAANFDAFLASTKMGKKD